MRYIRPDTKAKCNTFRACLPSFERNFALEAPPPCLEVTIVSTMPASRKKAIVRTLTGTLHPGYLPLSGLLNGEAVELLDLNGRILPVPLKTVRWIAYVRDFNLGDIVDPERLTRRTFLARPRAEGLWVRLTLAGGDTLEGLAPLDVSLVDGLLEDRGVYLIPPDIRSNTQRLFLPRSSFTGVQLLAVITTPSKPKPGVRTQQDLAFPEEG
jgi:hypothetical protein